LGAVISSLLALGAELVVFPRGIRRRLVMPAGLESREIAC
jgi:hypothetical protein